MTDEEIAQAEEDAVLCAAKAMREFDASIAPGRWLPWESAAPAIRGKYIARSRTTIAALNAAGHKFLRIRTIQPEPLAFTDLP